jgi:HPt (histidine-containing phosphotransfer) domain-containing protein
MTDSGRVLDLDALLESVGGDCELLDELAATFISEVPGWVTSLRAALASHDSATVDRVAHGVAGAVGYFRAPSVRQLAADLEALARAGQLDGAASLLDRLEAALLDLSRFLREPPWRH